MEKIKKIGLYLVFLYLALFPLGQVIRFDIPILGRSIPLHPTDVVAFLSFLILLLTKQKDFPRINKFKNFLLLSFFSLVFSLTFFKPQEIVVGSLYLLRLVSYFGLFGLTWNLVKADRILAGRLFKGLFLVVLVVSVLGWLQYFLLPDVRDLTVWGWDDHLYRLVGPFLDPTFTGIILVLGFLAGLVLFLKEKKLVTLVLLSVILSAIAYTYSRASYLALVVGVTYLSLLVKKVRLCLLILILFAALVYSLPRPASEGVILARTQSVFARLESYREGVEIFKKSPIFGIGFNNICVAKAKFLNTLSVDSHSCGGLDSSILFILATTGIIGFLVFLSFVLEIYRKSDNTLKVILAALLVHSFFSNSLFYPWVLGFVSILDAISISKE